MNAEKIKTLLALAVYEYVSFRTFTQPHPPRKKKKKKRINSESVKMLLDSLHGLQDFGNCAASMVSYRLASN